MAWICSPEQSGRSFPFKNIPSLQPLDISVHSNGHGYGTGFAILLRTTVTSFLATLLTFSIGI